MHFFNFRSIPSLILTILVVLFNVHISDAQYFEKVYGNDINTKGILFAHTSDHGIVILGEAMDTIDSVTVRTGYYILRLDSNGSVLWDEKIVDRNHAYANSIVTLKDGKIVILGTHLGDSYPIVAEVLMLDSAGNYYNSSNYPPVSGWGTAGVGLTSIEDTSVSLTLYNDGFISNNYYSIFTLNSDLTANWTDFVGFDGSFTNAHGITSHQEENIYTLSYYDDYFYSVNLLTKVSSIRKYNLSGSLLLDSLYEFNCVTTSITATKDGGAIILGTQDTLQQKDLVLIRLDNIGNVLWKKSFGSYLDEEANTVIETYDSGFAILSTIADFVIPGQHDIQLSKTNTNGDSLWSRNFGGTLDEYGLHLVEDNKNFIFLGSTTSFDNNRIYVVRTDSIGIIQSPFNIISSGRYHCEKDTISLFIDPSPASNMHLTWSNGDTTNPAKIYVSGNYYAVITDSSGHSFQTPFTPVYFAAIPDVNIGSDTLRLCTGVLLTDSTSELTNIYQWFFDNQILPGENFPFIEPTQNGSYQLVIRNYCASDTGITYIDSIFQNPEEPVITSPTLNFVCSGDSLRLSFNYNVDETYQWYMTDFISTTILPGETDSVFYANDNGSFLVKATNSNGCYIESSAKTVSFDYDEEFIDVSGPLAFCQGGEVELSVAQGSDFLWSIGDTSQAITVDSSGEYFVSFINENGCHKISDTVKITVYKNPKIYLGSDTVLCDGATILLEAGQSYTNYYWNDASTESTLLAKQDGPIPDTTDFFVFVTDTNGCIGGDTLNIIFDICGGVKELKDGPIKIFPNPVSENESFIVINKGNGLVTILIRDELNREIIKKQFKGSLRLNEAGALKPGIYFYYIFDDKKSVISGKLVVN